MAIAAAPMVPHRFGGAALMSPRADPRSNSIARSPIDTIPTGLRPPGGGGSRRGACGRPRRRCCRPEMPSLTRRCRCRRRPAATVERGRVRHGGGAASCVPLECPARTTRPRSCAPSQSPAQGTSSSCGRPRYRRTPGTRVHSLKAASPAEGSRRPPFLDEHHLWHAGSLLAHGTTAHFARTCPRSSPSPRNLGTGPAARRLRHISSRRYGPAQVRASCSPLAAIPPRTSAPQSRSMVHRRPLHQPQFRCRVSGDLSFHPVRAARPVARTAASSSWGSPWLIPPHTAKYHLGAPTKRRIPKAPWSRGGDVSGDVSVTPGVDAA